MSEIALLVNGHKFTGWKTARVTRGIEAVAGSFSLSLTERQANSDRVIEVDEGDVCEVSVDGEKLITGYVDSRSPSFGPGDDSLTIAGRDKTGDLVDCSALLEHWQFKGITLLKFAEKLCAPFGIRVSMQSGLTLPKPPAFTSIDPGDTAFNALEQACRKAGVLAVSDGNGGLLLTRAGTARAATALVEGENILRASGTFDMTNRFASYVVLGQHAQTDEFNGSTATAIKATASDPNVRAARKLVVRPEGNVTVEHAKKRAQWEATTRAARADSVSVTVEGWRQGDGALWPVNALASVRSKRLRVDGSMLITQAVYVVSDSEGTTTELSLKPPSAFKPEPTVGVRDGLWREISAGV